MVKLVAHAAANIEFYRRHYANDDFEVGDLKDFDSIKQIPLVSKKDLQLSLIHISEPTRPY